MTHDPQADTMRETSRGPNPLPRSSNTVCSASATPRTSGSFTFSSVALHTTSSQLLSRGLQLLVMCNVSSGNVQT